MSRPARSLLATGITLLLLLSLSACRLVGEAPPASSVASTGAEATPLALGSSAAKPSPASSTAGWLADPGTPYGVDEILDAMASSRRPGGVPEELQNPQVAATLAHRAWTWDGAPWESLSISAACGPDTCSLELAGAPAGGAGVDLYSFSVDPDARRAELLATDLHGYPASLEADLDAAARAAVEPRRLKGLALVGARWLPPPDTNRYWLAYRSGGEEKSPSLDVLLDLATGQVLEVRRAGRGG
jgi:hypothetical protein